LAATPQDAAALGELKTVLDEISQIDPSALVRKDAHGPFHFESGLPLFTRVLNLFRTLNECELEDVPAARLSNAKSQASNALTRFRAIESFDPEKVDNPKAQRDSLVQQLQEGWPGYYEAAAPLIVWGKQQSTDLGALERQARGAVALTKQLAEQADQQRGKMVSEMTEALRAIREAAAEAGVSQQATYFAGDATFYQRQSRFWLVATVVIGLLVLAYSTLVVVPELRDLAIAHPQTNLFPLALVKFAVVSLMGFLVVWCVRNFGSSRHNFVVNQHRANALKTFRAFVEATEDEATKDAVLRRATESIFAPQETGYTRGRGETSPPSHLTEILKIQTKGIDG
jgi:hypothetical protein